jgi:hypothetical protein
MAFASTEDAVEWCMEVQLSLVHNVEWPKALLDHPGAAEEWDEINERYHNQPPPPPLLAWWLTTRG